MKRRQTTQGDEKRRATSRRRGFCALMSGLTWVLLAAPAGAVDRALGADVAKPIAVGPAWSADRKARLATDLDALLAAAPTLRGAHVGLLALDTASGDVLYARNADDAFVPASTFKLLTGSAALALLGPAYRFRTQAYLAPAAGTGAAAAGQTLFLRAGGDPLLTSADIDALNRVAFATGKFVFPYPFALDAGGYPFDPYPPGWSVDDLVYDYAPKLTPAPVDENALELTVVPGTSVGAPLAIAMHAGGGPERDRDLCASADGAALEPSATTGAPGSPVTLDAIRNPPRSCIEVVGSLPLGAKPQALEVAVPEPTRRLYALIARGLPLPVAASPGPAASTQPNAASRDALDADWYRSSPVPPGARLVWSHDGEPLADLLADMWWPSDNFVAEMLLRAIGLQHGTPGTTERGADAERAWLTSIGIDPATLTIADGSGLSVYDRVTPRALVAILQTDWNGPDRDIVLDDLPLAGVRGTLERSFVGTLAERRTFAKTGSVSHARGLAGYLATLHHGAVTFAWSVDDWLGDAEGLAALRARVLSRVIGD